MEKRYLYHFDYPGVALGGMAIVLATDATAARRALVKHTGEHIAKTATIGQRMEVPADGSLVVFNWNGDY